MPVCIIPARGGSKRVPRKNLLVVDGIPILNRTIKSALDAGIFSSIIVSTDDEEALNIASLNGVIAYRRPSALGADDVPVVLVCTDVLAHFGITEDFCCLYATACLVKPSTLISSHETFQQERDTNVLIGVSRFNFPPVQALRVDSHGWASMLMPEFKGVRSQLHPKTYVSNGTFCWARSPEFKNELTFYSERLKTFVVADEEVCDLDYPDDIPELIRKLRSHTLQPTL